MTHYQPTLRDVCPPMSELVKSETYSKKKSLQNFVEIDLNWVGFEII